MNRHLAATGFPGAALPVALLAASLLFVVACDAPRDNPLDPNSPDFDPLTSGANDRTTTFFSITISTTHTEDDFAGDARYLVTTRVNLFDADGIDDVQLEVDGAFRFQMLPISNAIYSHTFNPGNFGYSIYDFTGAPFYIHAYDRKGHIRRSERSSIVRVLEQSPNIYQPANQADVGSQPLIVWREDTSPFPISYTVSIYRQIQDGSTIRFEILSQQSQIPRISAQGDTVDTFTVRQPLPPDNRPYVLTVTTEDEFQNRSISRAVGFYVRN